jgi:hypothetical protein
LKAVGVRAPLLTGHHRRIIDLKQGAIQARAVRREQAIQTKLTNHRTSAHQEAEELISRASGPRTVRTIRHLALKSIVISAKETSRTAVCQIKASAHRRTTAAGCPCPPKQEEIYRRIDP